ncbi:MAG TPA: hypothetical protein VF250_08045 [Conexibacter sp.]
MEGATVQHVVARVRDRGMVASAACVAAIAIAAWPVDSVAPGVAGDWSWVSTLSYAAHHGLRFGEQLIFTYGPLGFLDTWYGPVLYHADVLLFSWLYAALVQVLLAGALLAALRRSFPLAAAAGLAALALALAPDRTLALAFVWCALVVTRDETAPRGRFAAAFPFALGALTGVAVLGKLNGGVGLVALAAVTLAAVPSRRDAAAFAGAAAATAAAGWLATGQALGDVWPYLRHGAEVIAGYAAAMGLATPGVGWAYAVGAVVAALALALALTWGRDRLARRRWGLAALCAVYVGLIFKEGFTRMEAGHLEVFFGDMLVLLAAVPVRAWRRSLALGGMAACVAAFWGLAGQHEIRRTLNPYANAKAAADQVRTLASPARRDALIAASRAQVVATYRMAPEVARAIGRRPVMFWPFADGEVAWAYGFELRPLALLEPYAAYTPALDGHAADLLASQRAPARIARTADAVTVTLDDHVATFDAPLAARAIFCRYRQVLAADIWQVLARAPDRCGAPRALGTRTAAWGSPVAVPAPRDAGAAVVVHVDGAEPQGLERLRALLLRPHLRWIALDGRRHRLVAATAADGLLLSAPPQLDYPAPFAMAPHPRTIAVGRDGGQPGGTLAYRFEEIPLHAVSPLARAP